LSCSGRVESISGAAGIGLKYHIMVYELIYALRL
jgi:hypothetical protein